MSDSTAPRKKGQHKKPFEKRAKGERKWASSVDRKMLPDLIGNCPAISMEAKVAYWVLSTLLPCQINLPDLAVRMPATKDAAERGVKELLARKIVFYKVPPGGSRRPVYGMVMEAFQWDLESSTISLIGPKRKRGTWEKTKNLHPTCADENKFASDMCGHKSEFASDMCGYKSNLHPTCADENGHYYNSNSLKDTITFRDITLNTNPNESRPGPLDGPPPPNQEPPTESLGEFLARELPLGPMGIVQEGGINYGRSRAATINQNILNIANSIKKLKGEEAANAYLAKMQVNGPGVVNSS